MARLVQISAAQFFTAQCYAERGHAAVCRLSVPPSDRL